MTNLLAETDGSTTIEEWKTPTDSTVVESTSDSYLSEKEPVDLTHAISFDMVMKHCREGDSKKPNVPSILNGLTHQWKAIVTAFFEIGDGQPVPASAVVGRAISLYPQSDSSWAYEALIEMSDSNRMVRPILTVNAPSTFPDDIPAPSMQSLVVSLGLDDSVANWRPIYQNTNQPLFFPSYFINGNPGAGIPPHNNDEMIDFLINLAAGSDQPFPFPEFQSGCDIYSDESVTKAHKTGKGTIHLRAIFRPEYDSEGNQFISATSLPYNVSSSKAAASVITAVGKKKINGFVSIENLSAETDCLRIRFEKDEVPGAICSSLYEWTAFETRFSANWRDCDIFDEQPQPPLELAKQYIAECCSFLMEKMGLASEADAKSHLIKIWHGLKNGIPRFGGVLQQKAFDEEALIKDETCIITLSRTGMIKRTPSTEWKSYGRGAKGVSGFSASTTMDDCDRDAVEMALSTMSKSTIAFLSNQGRMFIRKAYEIASEDRTGKGTPIVQLIDLDEGERILTALPVPGFSTDYFLFTCTRRGIVKRSSLGLFASLKNAGIAALKIESNDELLSAAVTDGSQDVMLITQKGMAIRFSENDVRTMGRTSIGLKGITLSEDDSVAAMAIVEDDGQVLFAYEKGSGKFTSFTEFPTQSRGGTGAKCATLNEETGSIVSAIPAGPNDEVLLVSTSGKSFKLDCSEIPQQKRNSTGVILMEIAADDILCGVTRIPNSDVTPEVTPANNIPVVSTTVAENTIVTE